MIYVNSETILKIDLLFSPYIERSYPQSGWFTFNNYLLSLLFSITYSGWLYQPLICTRTNPLLQFSLWLNCNGIRPFQSLRDRPDAFYRAVFTRSAQFMRRPGWVVTIHFPFRDGRFAGPGCPFEARARSFPGRPLKTPALTRCILAR